MRSGNVHFISQIRKFAVRPTKHLAVRSENLLFVETNIYQSDQKICCSSNKHLSVRSENLMFVQQTFISQIRKFAVRPTNI